MDRKSKSEGVESGRKKVRVWKMEKECKRRKGGERKSKEAGGRTEVRKASGKKV